METVQANAEGVDIILTIIEDGAPLNLANATTKEIVLKGPDGDASAKTADFVTDGVDGKITYTTVEGDLDVAGVWQAQGNIALGGRFRTSIGRFAVRENL